MKRLAVLLSVLALGVATALPATVAFAAGSNLVPNPGFETASGNQPTSWSQGSWGTNKATFTYETTGHTGRSASVKLANYSNGDAKWYFAPINVTPGKTYTVSDWYKSGVATNLDAVVTNTSGGTDYYYLATPAASTAWKQQTTSFTAPANAKQLTIYHSISKNGTLTIDDMNIDDGTVTNPDPTPTPTPTPTPPTPAPTPPTPTPTPTPPTPTPSPTPTPVPGNLIANPSVETAANSLPVSWVSDSWGTNTHNFTYENQGQDGSHSVKTTISKYTSGDAKWYFTPVNVTAGTTYAYSEYYKSDIASEVDVMVTAKDGTVSYYYLGAPAASTANWTKLDYQFTAPANASTMTVFHLAAKKGYVQSDNFSLTAGNAQPTNPGNPSDPSGAFSRGLVSLTFDDGWRSIYTNGLPLLKKYNLVSTQYLNSEPITGGYPDYMTYQMVKDFNTQGSELAWHTRSHADLTTLTTAKIDTELNIPANFLTGIGQQASVFKNFATPYGAYNATAITEIKKFYGSHRSTDVGYNAKNNFDRYNIKVQNIDNTTTPATVKGWLDQAAATKTWLVIVYHEVDTNPEDTTYYVTPTNLDAELNLVKQSGLTVKTVQQSLDEITPQLP